MRVLSVQCGRRGGIPSLELTWDHRQFSLATDIDVYFCDTRSPWQRGSNEHTNGLLRQYFPKGTDLSAYSQAQLNKVARRLNERPRKTLGFETPGLMPVLHRSLEIAPLEADKSGAKADVPFQITAPGGKADVLIGAL